MYKTTFDYGAYVIAAQCYDINEFQEPLDLSITVYGDDGHEVDEVDDKDEIEVNAIERLYETKYEREVSF